MFYICFIYVLVSILTVGPGSPVPVGPVDPGRPRSPFSPWGHRTSLRSHLSLFLSIITSHNSVIPRYR